VKPAAAQKKPEPELEHSAPLAFTPGKALAPEKKADPAPAPKPPPPAPASGKTELSIEQSDPPEAKDK